MPWYTLEVNHDRNRFFSKKFSKNSQFGQHWIGLWRGFTLRYRDTPFVKHYTSISFWNFNKEIVQIDSGNVNNFVWDFSVKKSLSARISSEWQKRNWNALNFIFGTRVLLFQFHNPPMSFKMPKLSCTNKKIGSFFVDHFVFLLVPRALLYRNKKECSDIHLMNESL